MQGRVKISHMKWIFGYGSLIWRPGFQYKRHAVAELEGWTRRFSQGSPDHRGTPQRPGRVANLHPLTGSSCWGVAFEVKDEHWHEVLAGLDHRESGGYQRARVSVRVDLDTQLDCVTYVAPETNPHHLGLAPIEQMIEQMRLARGPSGENRDYLFELQRALKTLHIEDEHINTLAAALRARIIHVEGKLNPGSRDVEPPAAS